MADERYCYPPDFKVLKNKLGIRDSEELDRAERLMVLARTRQGAPSGNLDAAHVRAIHKHLFQDVYDWAGEYRTVGIGKGGSYFLPPGRIDLGMADVERSLRKAENYGRGLNADKFSDYAAEVIANLNFVHPFREGNGRTQTEFLRQLTERAGHELHSERINREGWIMASHISRSGPSDLLKAAITYAIDPDRTQTGDKAQAAVRDYLETIKSAIADMPHSQEKQAAIDHIGKVAKTYEVLMDRETKARFLPDQTRSDGGRSR
ncbi:MULTISPECIES: Fic/DOC family protein [unclassified Leisingera]|uniref:Fic/DOC family protein n=1 Tax=unclassified Leisingera TaxID=2614906 RepID=UPI0010104899|nr:MULTISPECIES: Fic family protein [unclassified Leisingera]MCF6433426.1 Fic family protein [Leisingera sp. MMG026]QAX32405.1 cell division protein [Leisingera sp. NJS204]